MKRKLSLLVLLLICICIGRASADITGTLTVCKNQTTSLAGTPAGGSWTSFSSNATVSSSGVVTGVAGGTAVISYTGTGFAYGKIVTVNAITSTNLFICDGATVTLGGYPSGTSGWSVSDVSLISLTVVSPYVVIRKATGASSGTATVSYTKNGCTATNPATVVVMGTITGNDTICANETTSLSYTGSSAGLTSAWSGANIYAEVDPSGVVRGKSGGSLNVSYTLSDGTNNCKTGLKIIVRDTGTIVDVPILCVGSSFTFTGQGGWSSTNGAIADFPSSTSKVLTGYAPGTVVINYAQGSCTSHVTATVNAAVSAIGGTLSVCKGNTTTLTNSNTGGTWSSSNTGVASVGPTGIVTGEAPGTATITYTGSGPISTSCAGYVTAMVTVYDLPQALVLSEGGTFCDHTTISASYASCCSTSCSTNCGTIYFQGTTSGGTSTSLGGTPQTITITGTYYFRAKSAAGCWGPESSVYVEINPNPAPITGITSTGVGGTTTLYNATPSGTWVPGPGGIADVDEYGVVTGLGCGSTLISYVLPPGLPTGCYVTAPVTIICPVTLSVCETAPIEICDTKFTYCPGFTLNVTGAPSGCTYSLPSGLTTHITSMTPDGSGGMIYTFGSSPETGDYTISSCGGSITIHIVKPVGTCYPCDGFTPECAGPAAHSFKTITSAVLSSPEISTATAGYYYIVDKNARLAVSPAVGSVFFMGDQVRLNIAAGDNIDITGCHFFSKTDQICHWAGIQINTDASGITPTIGQLTINGGSLLEHADTAVFVDSVISGGATPATGNILTVYNAVFNANLIGIRIRGFNNQTTLPFSFSNSVFTARNFTCYSASSAHYPYVWPSVSSLKSYSGDKNDPAYGVDAYTALTGVEMWGIDVIAVGKAVPTSTPDPSSGNAYTFYRVIVGDATNSDNSNLFDNLRRGVRALSSSVAFYNNVFRHTNNAFGPAYGIHFWNHNFYPNHTRNKVELSEGFENNTHNKFYNCHTAVLSQYAYNFSSRNTWISGTNERTSGTAMTIPAVNGIWLQDTMLDNHELLRDTIVNVQNAIVNDFPEVPICTPQGPITIKDNLIRGLTSSSSYEYTDFGIKVYDKRKACSTVAANSVTISHNMVEGCVNSINTKTLSINMLIEGNTVLLRDNGIFETSQRSGIICDTSIFVSGINKNLIYGDEDGVKFNLPTPGLSQPTGVGWVLGGTRGIYMRRVSNTSSTPTSVSCNNVHDVPIGFKFEGENNLKWRNNTMEQDTLGMVLQYWASTPASIGVQGDYCDPSDNKWTGSWSGNLQTYSIGSDPTLSTLYVRTSTGYLPSNNGNQPFSTGISGAAYLSPTTLINAVTGSCPDPGEVSCGTIGARLATPENDGLLPQMYNIVKAGQRYVAYPNPSNGNITIAREDGVNEDAKVRVINAIGATVYSGMLQLNNGKADLSIPNAAPGIYLVELTDSKGSNLFRISVEK